jgi:SAM-dependent methyltransferase
MESLKSVYNKKFHIWDSVNPKERWGFEELKKFIYQVGNGRILDLGCAAGAHSKYMSDAGLEVVGVDFSENMIKAAQKKVPKAKFMVMDILNLNLPPSNFDGIFARASLLHIRKDKILRVLKNLKETLKPKGTIYIAVKKGEGEREVFDKDRGTRFYAFYTVDELKNLAGKVNFKVSECYTTEDEHTTWIHCFATKG